MCELVNNVDFILKKQDKLSSEFGRLSKIYLHTTENIKGFLQGYSLQDKNILTVAGSGDQVLNSYLMGAKNITCFDINPLAFLQVKLKIAAVSTLSYSEYCDFFFKSEETYNSFFSPILFNKIKSSLDDDTLNFFNYLYSTYSDNRFVDKIYYRYSNDLQNMNRMNLYLDPEEYNRLATIIKDKSISFIESDITDLREHLNNERFDMIMLSNISDSIENIYSDNPLKNYKRLIHSLSKHLNKNGVIQVGYIYDYYSRQDGIFHNKKERQKIFTSDEFYTQFVESYRFHSENDAVITFHK